MEINSNWWRYAVNDYKSIISHNNWILYRHLCTHSLRGYTTTTTANKNTRIKTSSKANHIQEHSNLISRALNNNIIQVKFEAFCHCILFVKWWTQFNTIKPIFHLWYNTKWRKEKGKIKMLQTILTEMPHPHPHPYQKTWSIPLIWVLQII